MSTTSPLLEQPLPRIGPVQREHTPIRQRTTPPLKRVMDVLGVLCLFPVLAPLLALVALYIRCVSRGPILFVQLRLGHGGKYFCIYKFRTLHTTPVGRDEEHRRYVSERASSAKPIEKPDLSSSLIPGGELLRRLSIDELPQLINVWNGTMSLVGPRPDVLLRQDYTSEQLQRFEVLPGMTGLWQVSGKNSLTFEQMIDLDREYVQKQSTLFDLWILLRTLKVLLFERNE